MTDTFNFPLQVGTGGDVKHRVRKAVFGDGYSQGVGDGINTKTQDWSIKLWGTEAEMTPITAFLDAQQGYISFFWTPPGGVQGRYVCEAYAPIPDAVGNITITTTFKQVFR